MKSLSSSLMNKKTFASILAVLSIVGYGYFAFAVILPGQTLDPVADSLCTGPFDPDCAISQAWEQNLDDGFVFNLGSSIGIGTDTPQELLHISNGNLLLEAGNVNQSHEIDSSSIGSVLSGAAGSGLNSFQNYITGPSSLTGDRYDGISNFFLIESPVGNPAQITGFYTETISALSVDSPQAQFFGLNSTAIHAGTGDINQITGGFYIAGALPAPGALNNDVGDIFFAEGINAGVVLGSDATITGASALTLGIRNFSPFAGATGSIIDATGVSIIAFDGSGIPQIESDSSAYGIHIESSVSGVLPAIRSNNVYGIRIGANALDGAIQEYGLYIADGENYFSNGLRLTYDTDDSELYAFDNGVNYSLYFGNDIAPIATSTPSDERLKQDIAKTTLSLDTLNDITIVDFTYDQSLINDNNQLHHGVIAQDLNTIYPYAVKTQKDGYYVVDYTRLTPLLIRSVQELDLKLENIRSASSTVVSSGFSLNSIRNWLGDVGNGIEKIVSRVFVGERAQLQELCLGDRCITENQLDQLLDLIDAPHSTNNTVGQGNESNDGYNDQNGENSSDLNDQEGTESETIVDVDPSDVYENVGENQEESLEQDNANNEESNEGNSEGTIPEVEEIDNTEEVL